MKGLTSIKALGRSDLDDLIRAAADLRDTIEEDGTVEQVLDGLCVANLFFEPSTRTRLSFDLAAQRLGGHVITFDPETGSNTKGESLRDTAVTLANIGAHILVVRHRLEGVPQSIADWTGRPVVNAGDGANEHPTQTLLDAVTLRRRFGSLDGLRMAIVGDVARSRVAGSLIHAMPMMGVEVSLVGPEEWLPGEPPVATYNDLDRILDQVDVVYLLRVQTERGGVITADYVSRFSLDVERASRLGSEAVVMHAGPINRGVEITDEVAESPRSLVGEQVRNGVPTRMAVLGALARGLR